MELEPKLGRCAGRLDRAGVDNRLDFVLDGQDMKKEAEALILKLVNRSVVSLKHLTEIIISEFSYDGSDPDGVKAYQDFVDEARALIADLEKVISEYEDK